MPRRRPSTRTNCRIKKHGCLSIPTSRSCVRPRQLTGEPALALHFGEEVDLREMSIVALLGQACETGMEALSQLNKFGPLDIDLPMGGADRLELKQQDGRLWLIDNRPAPNAFPELTESAFARIVATGRRLGLPGLVREVHVTHPEPISRRRIRAHIRGKDCIWESLERAPDRPCGNDPTHCAAAQLCSRCHRSAGPTTS